MRNVFLILGILCLAYYLGVISFAGIRASFSGFWLLLGAVFLLAGAVCHFPFLQNVCRQIPGSLKIFAAAVLTAGLLVFLAAEGCVLSGMAAKGSEPADYIIVLGAQVRGTQVSLTLRQRLDRAAEYLQEHADTVVIVSGGQGADEIMSEAEAMKRYLEAEGIEAERILKEDRSVNTAQNIRFSKELIPETDVQIGIVSSDFHIFRAVHIAKAEGIEAFGIPAPTAVGMYPHNMVREAFAVLKDLALGNLVL